MIKGKAIIKTFNKGTANTETLPNGEKINLNLEPPEIQIVFVLSPKDDMQKINAALYELFSRGEIEIQIS